MLANPHHTKAFVRGLEVREVIHKIKFEFKSIIFQSD